MIKRKAFEKLILQDKYGSRRNATGRRSLCGGEEFY